MTTSESLDFFTEIAAAQPITQHRESSIASQGNVTYDNVTNQIAMQHQQTLPIIKDSTFDSHDRYSHEFFYQHPIDPSTKYHITCESLPDSLVEDILNDEICGMNFDVESLSLNQRFNLEQSLKQKLFRRMHCNRNTNSLYNNVVNHEIIAQTVSTANIQNYNDDDLPSNEHITYQDTNGLKDHSQQEDDFNNL